jgi:N-acetylglucosamine kinase
MEYLLAIDVGGTKCDALLTTMDGEALAWARSTERPTDSHYPAGFGRSEVAVERALAHLTPKIKEGKIHCAGYNIDAFVPSTIKIEYHVVREMDGPMALAGARHGLLALSGTGAFVFATLPDGRELYMDGLGPLYGDHGGAFQIGLAALRAVGKSSWAPRHATLLSQTVPDACQKLSGEENFHMVGFMLEPRSRGEIASLARLVDEAARQGDAIARTIIDGAADDLAETVRDLLTALNLDNPDLPLVGTGSVVRKASGFWERFTQNVETFWPNMQPKLAKQEAVLGSAIALNALIGGKNDEFRERLLSSDLKPFQA